MRITCLKFLPSNNITSRFQPMDVGIIASFKAQYEKRLIKHQTNCLVCGTNIDIDAYEVLLMIYRRVLVPRNDF